MRISQVPPHVESGPSYQEVVIKVHNIGGAPVDLRIERNRKDLGVIVKRQEGDTIVTSCR